MGRPHFVVIEKPEGGGEEHRMKQWLRDNPQYVPVGMDATDNTAYQLRRALKKQGWNLVILSDRVLIVKPDSKGQTSYAADLLVSSSEDDDEIDVDVAEEVEEAAEVTVGLERDLQSALRANIEQLEPGLKITDGGKERIVEAGRIDITATDAGSHVAVIELKAGTAKPEVLAQILAYMGCVAEEDKQPVRGIIVAADFHKKVILASKAVPNLELKKYSIQFKFAKPS